MIVLSERVRLVRAPNPGPMTLDGTNTYLVGGDDLLVIDPGPSDESHLGAVRAAVGAARVTAIVLTHQHHDHAEAARAFATAFDAQVLAYRQPADVIIAGDARVGGHGTFLRTIHTPGHAGDHLCLLLERERILFSGDHVLGRGTTVIAWPDGDMGAYMDSLERLAELELQRIFPGHGPVIEEPGRVLTEYREHRLMRERQVLDALGNEPGTPAELVARIYTDVDPGLHRVAELSVRAHLAKLEGEGRAKAGGDVWRAT